MERKRHMGERETETHRETHTEKDGRGTERQECEREKTVKKAAMKFDPTVKAEADDELAKLKKELAALAGNKEEDEPEKEKKTRHQKRD